MKIRQFSVKNYRSLRDVKLENIGNLTVLIGTNSSGKSNLLEALMLFFNELDPAVQRNIGAIDEYVWYDREYKNAIQFELTLELGKEEISDFIPSELLAQIESREQNTLTIIRNITGSHNSATWSTEAVKLNSEVLVEGGKFAFKPRKEEMVTTDQTAQPQPAATPKTPSPDYLGPILQNISKHLKGRFKLISAARNNEVTPSGTRMRSAFLPAAVLGDLTSLGQPIGRPREDERKWIAIDEKVRKACRNIIDVRVMGSRFTIREKESDMFFPVEATGGGYQEVMGLVCQLLKETDVFLGVEEPELHLHPELARKFFDILKDISTQNQIFITTHSTTFIDQADLPSTWLVKKSDAYKGKPTTLSRLSEPKDLRNILHELGLRPSDIFYANGVIFVEGSSDRVVFPIWAKKMGIDFEDLGISVIPTYGKACGKYHLTVWTDAAENTGIPFYAILDKGAEKEAKKLLKKLEVGENLFLLKKGPLEEYYPINRLSEALKQEFGIDPTEEEKTQLVTPKDESIEKLIQSKKKDSAGWKTTIGRIVAESMLVGEIDDEIKGILERVRTNLIQRAQSP